MQVRRTCVWCIAGNDIVKEEKICCSSCNLSSLATSLLASRRANISLHVSNLHLRLNAGPFLLPVALTTFLVVTTIPYFTRPQLPLPTPLSESETEHLVAFLRAVIAKRRSQSYPTDMSIHIPLEYNSCDVVVFTATSSDTCAPSRGWGFATWTFCCTS